MNSSPSPPPPPLSLTMILSVQIECERDEFLFILVAAVARFATPRASAWRGWQDNCSRRRTASVTRRGDGEALLLFVARRLDDSARAWRMSSAQNAVTSSRFWHVTPRRASSQSRSPPRGGCDDAAAAAAASEQWSALPPVAAAPPFAFAWAAPLPPFAPLLPLLPSVVVPEEDLVRASRSLGWRNHRGRPRASSRACVLRFVARRGPPGEQNNKSGCIHTT